jgi:hypothetical protein
LWIHLDLKAQPSALEGWLLVKLEREPEPGDGAVVFSEDGGDPFTFIVTKLFPPEREGTWIGIKPLEGRCPTWGTLHLSSSARELDGIRSAIKAKKTERVRGRCWVGGTG